MPTEISTAEWLLKNWPSVAFGLSAATIYVAAYLKLHTFLSRLQAAEQNNVLLAKQVVKLQAKVAKIAIYHCQKYPDDMESLMQLDISTTEENNK